MSNEQEATSVNTTERVNKKLILNVIQVLFYITIVIHIRTIRKVRLRQTDCYKQSLLLD